MTKYEYIHNREHKKRYLSHGDFYSTPVERVITIVLINIIICCLPVIIIYTNYMWWIFTVLCLIHLFIWTQYNIFYNLERFEYFIYYLFGKKSIYKEFIMEMSQYENVVKYENKLGFKLRKSYLNCLKIIFHSQKYNGYFTNKYLVLNKKKYPLNCNEMKSINQLIEHIKSFKKEY